MRAGLTAESARIDAEVLARHVLGWDRARLVADGRDPMPADVGERFATLIERRAAREPVAFIIGHREFWGLDFDVSPDVLIPQTGNRAHRRGRLRAPRQPRRRAHDRRRRHRQRLPRDRARARVPGRQGRRHRHLRRRPGRRRRNAPRHGVDQRVTFVRGDLLEPVQGPSMSSSRIHPTCRPASSCHRISSASNPRSRSLAATTG